MVVLVAIPSGGGSIVRGGPSAPALQITSSWTRPLQDFPEYGQNPCKLNGDFDGDSRTDVAEQVVEV